MGQAGIGRASVGAPSAEVKAITAEWESGARGLVQIAAYTHSTSAALAKSFAFNPTGYKYLEVRISDAFGYGPGNNTYAYLRKDGGGACGLMPFPAFSPPECGGTDWQAAERRGAATIRMHLRNDLWQVEFVQGGTLNPGENLTVRNAMNTFTTSLEVNITNYDRTVDRSGLVAGTSIELWGSK